MNIGNNLIESLEPRRLFDAGDPDTTFGTDGFVREDSGVEGYSHVLVQNDGKVIVASRGAGLIGFLTLKRFTKNGAPDTDFAGGLPLVAGAIHDVTLGPDGSIYVLAEEVSGPDSFTHVYKYTPAGQFDETWGDDDDGEISSDLDLSANGGSILVQGNSKLLIASTFGNSAAVERYRRNGLIDEEFGTDGRTAPLGPTQVSDAVLDANGNVVVSGIRADGSDFPFLARVNREGAFDTSFGDDGIATINSGGQSKDLKTVPGVGIYVLGFASGDLAVRRFTDEGQLDTSFAADGVRATGIDGAGSSGAQFVIQPDGRFIVGTLDTATSSFHVARFHEQSGRIGERWGDAGEVLTSFAGADEVFFNGLAIQVTGRVIAVGGLRDDVLVLPDTHEGVIVGYENDAVGGGILVGRNKDVTIHSSPGNDTVRVRGSGEDDLVAHIGPHSYNLPNNIRSFTIFGFDGDDTLRLDKPVDVRAFLDGMNGDDALSGGAAQDDLYGNKGADTLNGRGGKDVLDGGDNADILFGADGFFDALFGGKGNDKAETDGATDILRSIEEILEEA